MSDDAAGQLAEFRAALARMADPEAEQPAAEAPATDDAAEPTSLIQAMHPGAVPRFSEADQQKIADNLQASADHFWTGWTS